MTAPLRLAGLLAAVALIAGCGSSGGSRPAAEGAPPAERDLEITTEGWKTDFSRHSVPLRELISGGPPRDGIPPIDDPKPVSAAEAGRWLGEREPVLVAEVGGQARARFALESEDLEAVACEAVEARVPVVVVEQRDAGRLDFVLDAVGARAVSARADDRVLHGLQEPVVLVVGALQLRDPPCRHRRR